MDIIHLGVTKYGFGAAALCCLNVNETSLDIKNAKASWGRCRRDCKKAREEGKPKQMQTFHWKCMEGNCRSASAKAQWNISLRPLFTISNFLVQLLVWIHAKKTEANLSWWLSCLAEVEHIWQTDSHVLFCRLAWDGSPNGGSQRLVRLLCHHPCNQSSSTIHYKHTWLLPTEPKNIWSWHLRRV